MTTPETLDKAVEASMSLFIASHKRASTETAGDVLKSLAEKNLLKAVAKNFNIEIGNIQKPADEVELREIIKAALEVVEREAWQPIEDAPSDEVFLFKKKIGSKEVCFIAKKSNGKITNATENYLVKPTFFEEGEFMHLPKPPKEG